VPFRCSSTATDITINRSGIEVINSDAVDFNAIVGGQQFVESGGFAENADVVAGGIQSVLAGGVAFNTSIDGGNVEFASGTGSGSTVVFNSDTGGQLILDNSQGFTGTIAGFSSPSGVNETIDLRDIGAGAKATFTQTGTSGTLTVTDTAGHTANLTLLGTYSTANFSLSSDGAGGTLIKDPW
jgi:autotransporter passenger strand-loop-strand repeat protein